jgi:hypothetical protein
MCLIVPCPLITDSLSNPGSLTILRKDITISQYLLPSLVCQ